MLTSPALTEDQIQVFDLCPAAMMLVEVEGFRIRAANAAAARRYGYARADLTSMTLLDLGSSQDAARMIRRARHGTNGGAPVGRANQITKSGATFVAEVLAQRVDVADRPCVVVTLHDVTRRAPDDGGARSRASDAGPRELAELFGLGPGNCAVLTPDSFDVVAVTDGYLDTMGLSRGEIVGRPLPDLFPASDQPRSRDPSAVLRASLHWVAHAGRGDVLPAANLPAARPDANDGDDAAARDWVMVHMPLKARDGSVAFVHHSVHATGHGDVDGSSYDAGTGADHGGQGAAPDRPSLEQERLVARLVDREAQLRAISRMSNVHVWRADIATRRLDWSDGLRDLCGVPASATVSRVDDYVALVHPDDRADTRARIDAVVAGQDRILSVAHRIVRPDGRIVHVKGTAERVEEHGRAVLSGVVQDVTAEVQAEAEARRRDHLLRIACDVGRIGGWRVDLASGVVEWSPQFADGHTMPDKRRVSLSRWIGFCAPEYRACVSARLDACAQSGTAFDDVLQLETARGSRVWVRAVGAPERDPGGRIVAVQGAFQDITELTALHRTTEELRARLDRTLDDMGDAFMIIDGSWRFSYLNREAAVLLRRDRDALLGKLVWTQFRGALGTRFGTRFHEVADTGRSVEFEEFFAPLARWFRVTVHPSVDGLAIHFRDVTEDRADAERLRLLDAAVARMHDVLLITEATPIDAPDGPQIVFANPAFEALTGYARDEVIGATPRLLHGPGTDRAELDRIRAALERQDRVRAEVVNYGRDGRRYWLEMDISPLVDDDGTPTHFVALQRNTTERRKADAQLRLSEERFRLVTEATRDAIWDWNLQSGQVWWSDNMLRVFGHDPARAGDVGFGWRDYVHPADVARVMAGLDAVAAGSVDVWHEDYRFLSADGRTVYVQDRGVVLRDADGRAVRMIGSMADVTEERTNAAILRQSQKLEALGQLTGGIAHDFNNLLTVILGNAELLVEGLPGHAKLHDLADHVIAAAHRGAELTGRLLAFARQQPLDPVVTDLNAVVRSVVPFLKRSLGEDVQTALRLADSLPRVEIDPGQLENALLNLAINARDAMPSGGKLTIETHEARVDDDTAATQGVESGRFVVVAVTDTGEGISDAHIERVLEPFFSTKAHGSGLGLPMVFGFARQSGGHMKIASALGEGTTIRLFFPRAASDAVVARPGHVVEDLPRGRGELVLVVEDNPFVRRSVVAMLDSLGYRALAAEDADAALEHLAARDDVSVLFTDIVMPGSMNGRALATAAAQLRPDLPVVFTSGYLDTANVHEGLRDSATHLLAKPYKRQDLAKKLRRVLDAVDGPP